MSKFSGDSHPLVTADEAAAMLRLSKGTLHNWLSQKRLTKIKIGRKTFLSRDEILGLIEGTSELGQAINRKQLIGLHRRTS